MHLPPPPGPRSSTAPSQSFPEQPPDNLQLEPVLCQRTSSFAPAGKGRRPVTELQNVRTGGDRSIKYSALHQNTLDRADELPGSRG